MVKEDEFSLVLLSFFHNGVCFRSDLFPLLIAMLEDLQASIKALPTFRYYGCSLIVLYDGAICPEGLKASNQEKDFNDIAERARRYSKEDADDKKRLNGTAPNSYYSFERENSPPPFIPPHLDSKPEEISSRMSAEDLAQARCHVDLRMIDFAHSTHSGYMDPVKHAGCDNGYLKGLDTLIKILKEAKRTYCDEKGCM